LFYSYFWYFCLNWLPSYFLLIRKLSPSQMAIATAMPLALMAALSMTAGRVADRMISGGGNSLRVRAAFAAGGFTGGVCLFLLPAAASIWQASAVLALSLGSVGIASANYWALTQAAVPPALIGRAIAYQNMLGNVGGISAPLISGFLIAGSSNFFASIWLAAIAVLIAGLSYASLLYSPSSLRPLITEADTRI
jgi:MFS family permease